LGAMRNKGDTWVVAYLARGAAPHYVKKAHHRRAFRVITDAF